MSITKIPQHFPSDVPQKFPQNIFRGGSLPPLHPPGYATGKCILSISIVKYTRKKAKFIKIRISKNTDIYSLCYFENIFPYSA